MNGGHYDSRTLVEALKKRGRSVVAYVNGEPVYLMEAAAELVEGLAGQVDQVRDAWWTGTEHGEAGVVYTDGVTDAMDAIWAALSREPALQVARDVEVRALRQAASRVPATIGMGGLNRSYVSSWLRAEADRIEAGL